MGMSVFENPDNVNHEQVVFCRNDRVGLKAIIAIHDTSLGPALGGCRMYSYKSEEAALRDVLRLSRGMTYKAAMAKLNLGGGKSVIIGSPKRDKSEGLFRAFGQFVDSLEGRYITAEDSGTNVVDMEVIRQETPWVTGAAKYHGSGDPSPVTAWGVFNGMRAAVEEAFGSDDFEGMKVAIQGVGNVGRHLARHLHESGAKLWVTDIEQAACARMSEEYDATVVEPDAIFGQDVDVLAPCALGGVLNDDTIPQLKCKVIAGAANNQLDDEERHDNVLADKGIVYAPDYAINAGGLINVYTEIIDAPVEKGMKDAEGIYDTLKSVFAMAKEKGVSTHEAANRVAEERIATMRELKAFHRTA